MTVVATQSTMLTLGTEAPDFELADFDGKTWSLGDFADRPALVVAFICNHCPYVAHIRDSLAEVAEDLRDKGAGVVAIASNDTDAYPQDGPEEMKAEAEEAGYTFPYLFDEDQEVAKAYRAACTPDFFVFDGDRRLAYRGQFDESRPGSETPVTGDDLRRAVDAVLDGDEPSETQHPSMGCNIKWSPGNEPPWFA